MKIQNTASPGSARNCYPNPNLEKYGTLNASACLSVSSIEICVIYETYYVILNVLITVHVLLCSLSASEA